MRNHWDVILFVKWCRVLAMSDAFDFEIASTQLTPLCSGKPFRCEFQDKLTSTMTQAIMKMNSTTAEAKKKKKKNGQQQAARAAWRIWILWLSCVGNGKTIITKQLCVVRITIYYCNSVPICMNCGFYPRLGMEIMQSTGKIAYMRNIDISEISCRQWRKLWGDKWRKKNNKQTFKGGGGDAVNSARLESNKRVCGAVRPNVTLATYISSLRVSGSRFEEGARNCVAVNISRIITTH